MLRVSFGIVALLCSSSVAGCSPSEWVDVHQAMYQQTVTYFTPTHHEEYITVPTADDAVVVGQ